MKDAKILVCYNAPVSVFSLYNGKPENEEPERKDLSEEGFSKEMEYLTGILKENFSEVQSLAVDRRVQKVIDDISAYNPDVILNFVESVEGIAQFEYCMAALFELLGYHYTGNIPSSLGNCLDKERAKSILRSFGINTPGSLTLEPHRRFSEKDIDLNYPLIMKLLDEDASIGISEYSVVKNYKELKKHYKFLSESFKKSILVEEYIDGRELNIAILGDKVLPVSEILFDGLPDEMPKIVTYDGKWIDGSVYYNFTKPKCPADLPKRLQKKVEEIALTSFKALNCRDYARVDVRLDQKGTPFVIEVNPNPDISRDSGFARAANAAGINYTELLLNITGFALSRKENDKKTKAS
ncbi:MAG: ATP-grasp domain-containing protein [Ignavibacteriaceae bacterium]